MDINEIVEALEGGTLSGATVEEDGLRLEFSNPEWPVTTEGSGKVLVIADVDVETDVTIK